MNEKSARKKAFNPNVFVALGPFGDALRFSDYYIQLNRFTQIWNLAMQKCSRS